MSGRQRKAADVFVHALGVYGHCLMTHYENKRLSPVHLRRPLSSGRTLDECVGLENTLNFKRYLLWSVCRGRWDIEALESVYYWLCFICNTHSITISPSQISHESYQMIWKDETIVRLHTRLSCICSSSWSFQISLAIYLIVFYRFLHFIYLFWFPSLQSSFCSSYLTIVF